MDDQKESSEEYPHKALTYAVIGAAMEVHQDV